MNNLKSIFIREEIIKSIRSFFYAQQFHEVITPTLNEAIPNEANIYPFTTVWRTNHGEKKYFLSTSPERGLKLMLAKKIGNCFAISKSFRNLEDSGSQHIPEFLMLEWYRENADYQEIMIDTENLISFIKNRLNLKNTYTWKKLSLIDAFHKYADIDYLQALKTKHFYQDFDQIFVNKIEPHISENPTFIIDYPSLLSPLCKPKKENQLLAERFELYIKGMEIANGNTENTDYQSIEKTFIKEQKLRKRKGLLYSPVDQEFLDSLKTMSKKSYAGIGLGIDRLAMLFSGTNTVNFFK